MAPIVARRFEEVFDLRLVPEHGPWPAREPVAASAG
jgi:hypothetical protein